MSTRTTPGWIETSRNYQLRFDGGSLMSSRDYTGWAMDDIAKDLARMGTPYDDLDMAVALSWVIFEKRKHGRGWRKQHRYVTIKEYCLADLLA